MKEKNSARPRTYFPLSILRGSPLGSLCRGPGEAKARRVNLVSILTAGLSTLTLVFCFLTDDFRLAYVARNSARSLPVLYKISALWAGQSGSLLLWLLILSFYSFAVQRSRPLREGGLNLG